VTENGSIASNCIEKIDDDGKATCLTEVRKDEGNHTFTASASSFDENGDGIFVRDVTDVRNDPDPVRYRWTSIAFEAFHCDGTNSQVQDCETSDWTPGERVDVTVTAVEADTGNVLPNATITIDGNQETTDENGTATRSFISFGEDCLDVTAAGVEATIEDQTVDWDTPRTETICWKQ